MANYYLTDHGIILIPAADIQAGTMASGMAFVAPALGTPASGTLTNCTFPTLNQNTSGSAASLSVSGQTGLLTFTGLTSTNRAKTVRDAADTVLELGGSYTPTGTWTSLTLVTPALGTPASGTLTNCTFPTLNQNTSGTAANLSGTPALPNGTTATTQSPGDNSTKIATTAYVAANAGGSPAFSSITTGTNTVALITGTSGSHTTSGTGIIQGTNASQSVINVKSKGAVIDGSTNDSTDVQAAFTATGTTYNSIYFPMSAGNACVLTTAITDPNTGDLQYIWGDGAFGGLITTGTNNLLTLSHVTDNTSTAGFRMHDLVFAASGAGTGYTSIAAQTLVAMSNANHQGGGADCSGVQVDNCQFINCAGTAMTVNTPILNSYRNNSIYGCAAGFKFTETGTAGTTIAMISDYANTILGAGYEYDGAQAIAHVATAMDTFGTGILFNNASAFGILGCDAEIGTAWEQSITTVAATATTLTITVANTYSAGQVVSVRGGTSGNATLNGRWKIATASSTQFTVTVSGFTTIGSNSPAGMKSSVYSGDALSLTNTTICGAINGMQMFNPAAITSAYMMVDGSSGLTTVTGYSNNSATNTNDIILMPGSQPMLFQTCNFGQSTEGAAILQVAAQGGVFAGGNYSVEGCTYNTTFGSAWKHIVLAGSLTATNVDGVLVENGTGYASTGGASFASKYHNSSDTNTGFLSTHAGTAANHFTANNGTSNVFAVNQAGVITTYDGLTTAGLGMSPVIYSYSASTAFGTFNTASAVTMLANTGTPAGFYQITYHMVITTSFVTNTEVKLTFGWTDADQASTMTLTTAAKTAGTYLPPSAGGAITTTYSNSFAFYSTGTAAITWTPAVTGSNATAGAAWVAVVLERLA